jgi:hypothetical protein
MGYEVVLQHLAQADGSLGIAGAFCVAFKAKNVDKSAKSRRKLGFLRT